MDAIIERGCGLDVHQASITACLFMGKADEKPTKEVRRFGTMTGELRELSRWLASNGCTHVSMESTGVYWMPVYKVLEDDFEVIVGNAQHLAKVPGRKTDALDSEWLAELLRHGLLRKSFIPPKPIRELRDLTRYRRKLVQSRTSERNRLQKLLETANIKLATVLSNVFGVSGMAMLRALVDEKLDPGQLAELARGRARQKMKLLELALDGRFEEHHRYLLRTQLGRLEQLDKDIIHVEQRINAKLEPYREQYTRLMQIPGVERTVASGIIAELGVDMNAFGSAEACASWAGVCPGNNESAGKRKSSSSNRGNTHLKTLLVEAAHAAARTKGTYLGNKFHRLKARRGYKRAAMAIAHKILVAAYYMLAKGENYRELGDRYLDTRDEQRVAKKLVRRLETLGYRVTLEEQSPTDAASPENAPTKVDAATPADAALSEINPADAAPSEAALVDAETLADAALSEVVSAEAAPSEVASVEPVTPAGLALALVVAAAATSTPTVDAAPVGVVSSVNAAPSVAEPADTVTIVDSTTDRHESVPSERPSSPGSEKTSTVQSASRPIKPKGRRKRRERDPRLPPVGTILTRVFDGVTYEARITEGGFEYQGIEYSSISATAQAITGKRRNGYRFFRLTQLYQEGSDAHP